MGTPSFFHQSSSASSTWRCVKAWRRPLVKIRGERSVSKSVIGRGRVASQRALMGTGRVALDAGRGGWLSIDGRWSRGQVYYRDTRWRPYEAPIAICNFLNDFREQLVLHGGSFGVVNHVADGEFERSGIYSECDGRFQRRICASIIVTHHFPGGLRFDQVLTNRLSGCLQEQ